MFKSETSHLRCHHALYCNLSKKKAGKLAGRTVPRTELRVTRGNGQKEEEAVMSRSDCVSCPTFLSIPPAHTHTQELGGGMWAGEHRRDRGESEGLKRTGVWIQEIKSDGMKGPKQNQKIEKKGHVLNKKPSDLRQLHTLSALVSLSSNYFSYPAIQFLEE